MDLAMPSVDLDLHERSQCMADAAAGHTNASLVMSTVRGDGINLQPDRPATMTDGVVCLKVCLHFIKKDSIFGIQFFLGPLTRTLKIRTNFF
jgi:hypothetical protein